MDEQDREGGEGREEASDGGGGNQYYDSFFLRWLLPNSIH